MKHRQFIKVVGTAITGIDGGRLETTVGRGIVRLPRGTTKLDFITAFLSERGITSFSIYERGDGTSGTAPMMHLTKEPKLVLTYTFTLFSQPDFGFYAKDLTKAELERDLRPMWKVFANG